MPITPFPQARGLRLGLQTNTFNNINQATTEADRDAYFSANPAKLASYNGDSNLMIRLVYLDGAAEITRYQVRINNAWVDYTPVVTGLPGEVASLAAVKIGEVPYKLPDGTFGSSGMKVLSGTTVLAPPGFSVESGSVTFGEALTVSEVSGYLGLTNHVNGNLYTLIDFNTPDTAASQEPHIFFLTSGKTEFVAQGTDTTNLPNNPLVFNYTIQNTARSHALKFRTYAAMSNVRARISLVSTGLTLKYIPDRQTWEEGVGGLNWALGDNTFEFGDTPLNLEAGMQVKFEIYATSVSLKGNALGVPYFSAMIQPGNFVSVITGNTYTASDVKTKLESLSSPNKLSKTAIQDGVTSVNSAFGDVVITKSSIGLGNVDNTSDANKPVSTAQASAISTSMSNHLADSDPHPQYTTTAEASAAAPVQSVNSKTGSVTLSTSDVLEGANLYYNDGRVTNYLSVNGYTVKSVGSTGAGVSLYKGNTSGAVAIKSVVATAPYTVTSGTDIITIGGPALSTGTYSPTLQNISNITTSSATQCRWVRVDDMVTVNGSVTLTPTQNNQSTKLGISLPVASNIGAIQDVAGTAQTTALQGQGAAIYGDAANDRAILEFLSNGSVVRTLYFTFIYQII